MNTDLSRRGADVAVQDGRVSIGGMTAELGSSVETGDSVTLDGVVVHALSQAPITIALNKPVGYVCSRDGQGSPSIYQLIPQQYDYLNIAGRLDKASSGLVILTSDGNLLNKLTHPSSGHTKQYLVQLIRPLSEADLAKVNQSGVDIGDARLSRFNIVKHVASSPSQVNTIPIASRDWQIVTEGSIKNVFTTASLPRYLTTSFYTCTLSEGRNRQIRRTFEALHYQVLTLHRTSIQ
jgi:23S rRNA pseudouridine2605 synthase